MTDDVTNDSGPAHGVRLSAGDTEVTVDPAGGGQLSSLRVGGIELLRQGEHYGSFPMVPWCGRIELGRFRTGGDIHQMPVNAAPHAIHGTGRDTAWRTVRTSADESGRSTSAAFTYDLAEPWPYSGRVTQLVELAEDSLTLTMGVETYDDSFPAQIGWHPWFRRNLGTGKDVEIDFRPAWQEERGADHLPTGRRIEALPGPWDDCFGMPEGVDVTLTWPGGRWSSRSPAVPSGSSSTTSRTRRSASSPSPGRRTGSTPCRDWSRPSTRSRSPPPGAGGHWPKLMAMTDVRDALLQQIKDKAVVHGKVTLSSGKEADYYIDLRRITLDAEAAPLVGQVMLDATADLDFDAVGGLTLGADPVATSMLHAAAARGRKLDAFVVRKAQKTHGMQRRIEGPDIKGRRVLVVEDTSTTGGSPLTAVEAAREAGAEVVAVATIVDRGAEQAIADAGLRYVTGYSLGDLGLS
ncbi:hypothetical protein GCM10020000_42340 [Streptomyces olivoverticillatus]